MADGVWGMDIITKKTIFSSRLCGAHHAVYPVRAARDHHAGQGNLNIAFNRIGSLIRSCFLRTQRAQAITSCNNDELVNHVLAHEEEYARTGNAVDFLEMMADFKNEFEW